MACKGKKIPALMEKFEGVRGNCLLIALGTKTLIPHQDTPIHTDGTDDGLEEFFASWYILENNTILQ